MKVSVIGTGYVGLVSGVCLAEKGHEVICVDKDQEKVNMINRGSPPIYEPGLDDLLKCQIRSGLTASTDLQGAVAQTEISLVAVGTPFDGDRIDLTYIEQASEEIGKALQEKPGYHVVVVKSTVVPGTTDQVVLPILERASSKKAGIDFGVGMNPEFLREGEAIQDFMNPDRIVMGAMDERSLGFLEKLYEPFVKADKLKTNNKTAEMIKYASNSLLATMISFSNEIGNMCSAVGDVDVVDVMRAVHLDKRLSPIVSDGSRVTPAFTTYLEAGCGFGGSCFPKDLKALVAYGKRFGLPMNLLDAVIEINSQQPKKVLAALRKHYPQLDGTRVAVLGLAFKPGTDDMRESPAIPIVKELLAQRAMVNAYDPVSGEEAKRLFGNTGISYCKTLQQAVDKVDAILLLTRWEEFRQIPEILKQCEIQPLVVDGRRFLDKKSVSRYEGIGL